MAIVTIVNLLVIVNISFALIREATEVHCGLSVCFMQLRACRTLNMLMLAVWSSLLLWEIAQSL